MSFTLDKCALSQSASPCMPYQRGKTEYTGFRAWLKTLDLSLSVAAVCARMPKPWGLTCLKVNTKCFAAIFSVKFCSSCFRPQKANSQNTHSKHHVSEAGVTRWNMVGNSCFVLCFCVFQLPPTFTLCHVIIASYLLAQVRREADPFTLLTVSRGKKSPRPHEA